MGKIQRFIHANDYVHRKQDLENEIKELHSSKKYKPLDNRQKPPVHDHLGLREQDVSLYDYTPLKILQSDILWKIESLRILDKLVKMLSPSNKRNKAKFCQFHEDYGHDIE